MDNKGKGLAYPRTTWAYGERPVTSAKLNAWDAHIAAALELAFNLINRALGGGDGVIFGLADMLRVEAGAPPGMTVTVRPGSAFIAGMPFRLTAPAETTPITPPTGAPRVDAVRVRLSDWGIFLQAGNEHAAPQPPAPTSDTLTLAELYLRPEMNAVRNADNGTDGYIIDRRPFLAGGPVGG